MIGYMPRCIPSIRLRDTETDVFAVSLDADQKELHPFDPPQGY